MARLTITAYLLRSDGRRYQRWRLKSNGTQSIREEVDFDALLLCRGDVLFGDYDDECEELPSTSSKTSDVNADWLRRFEILRTTEVLPQPISGLRIESFSDQNHGLTGCWICYLSFCSYTYLIGSRRCCTTFTVCCSPTETLDPPTLDHHVCLSRDFHTRSIIFLSLFHTGFHL